MRVKMALLPPRRVYLISRKKEVSRRGLQVK